MNRFFSFLVLGVLFLATAGCSEEKTITIKGKVRFPDDRFNMSIVKYSGFDRIVVDSCKPDADGRYEFKMKVDFPGVYTLDCQKWQAVNFWAEDEDLEIDFRGKDTAKIVIKNPPYVHIYGGPNNDLMNLLNWDSYRNYQLMIGIAQRVYKIEGLEDKARQQVSMDFYDMLGQESVARLKYLAERYSGYNSVLAVLPMLKGEDYAEFVDGILRNIEKRNPGYPPLLKYKKEREEAKALKEKLSEGKLAPEFSYPTPAGDAEFGPQDFRGSILVLDFWASWCGPCRAEIQNLKKDYKEFEAKGVAFLSVSIDKDEGAWHKALQEERMPWTQVIAPKAGKDIMKQYQFSGIPYIVVLDKDGRIVAKNLRGEALTDKLKELTAGKKNVAMPAMGM